jgi:putative secretion ATPase (PEP-CTERM system associated)
MYERFYHLRERPFALSPDPDYLYPSRVHQEALDYLRYGFESHAGFVMITGEIGSGKTTLLQSALRTLDGQTTVARLVNTLLDPREVLEALMVDLGLDPSGKSKPLMLRDLAQFLVDQRMQGRMVLVVIDEAQNLSAAALEELRMLSNLETEKSKLMQIVMIGQPDLRAKLHSPELEQLRQRITVSYHLNPLDADDTARYINHRLRRAAIGAPVEVPRDVTDIVHARARGVPRMINVICDAILVFGYAEERHHIDTSLAREALQELEATGVLPPPERAESRAGDIDFAPPAAPARVAAPALDAVRSTQAVHAGSAASVPAGLPPQPAVAARPPIVTPREQAPPRMPRADAPPVQPSVQLPREELPAQWSSDVLAIKAREEELRRRELLVEQRERELAEQRRVLSEEYRLLRKPRATEPAPALPTTSAPPPPASPAALSRPLTQRATSPAPAYVGTVGRPPDNTAMRRAETFWSRLRRMFLGVTEPFSTDRIGRSL